MELSNKLQTQRNKKRVDLANLRVNTNYYLHYKDGDAYDDGFADFLADLELIPYSWMRLDGDANYNRSAAAFTEANFDVGFTIGPGRSIGIGQRYQRKGGKEATFGADWRISPKWRFGMYERYQFTRTADVNEGLQEHQYTFSRDLHCWILDFTYNIKKAQGHTIWMVFKLKAFPDLTFGLDQSYNSPKSGSSNQ
jgi:hypothetical protein